MSITWSDVTKIAPELASGLTADQQNAILADVALLMSADAWGSKLDMGSKYLAAHLGALAKGASANAPAGPLTSETVGPNSRSWAAPTLSATDDYDSTAYGRRYLALVKTLGARVGYGFDG